MPSAPKGRNNAAQANGLGENVHPDGSSSSPEGARYVTGASARPLKRVARGWYLALSGLPGRYGVFSDPGRWPISVNLSETVSVPLAGRLGQDLADGFPFPQHPGQTLWEQQRRSYLTVHEFNLPPPTALGLPRHSPRGKMLRRCAPSVRSTTP